MTTWTKVFSNSGQARVTREGYPADRLRFDWALTFFIMWFLGGIFLDGWAHNTFDAIETFFTPWHGVLYSGFLASATVLGVMYGRNVLAGYALTRALPRSYMFSLAGAVIFALGGGFDFAWHALLGFEADMEALLSPAHLWLAVGATLIFSGPFRAAWERTGGQSGQTNWRTLGPALISLLAVLSLFTFFTQYANAFQHPNLFVEMPLDGEMYPWNVTLMTSILIPTALTMSFILLAVRRWTLPAGSLTFLLTINAALMFIQGQDYGGAYPIILLAVLAAGIVADILLVTLKPSMTNVRGLRVFAFAAPFVLYAFFFLALGLTGGLWWSPHMWAGAPFLAGITGWGLSWLLAPPGNTTG